MIDGENTTGFINRSYGFQMNFDNGYALSIAWGPMHYCDNRSLGGFNLEMFDKSLPAESKTCEVACYDLETNKIISLDDEGDQVLGWIDPAELVKIINEVSNWPTKVLT